MKEAIILVGGLGTRLGALVDQCPKPMLIVQGRPFLEWIILYCRSYGIKKIILATGYKSEVVVDYFGDGSGLSVEIAYSEEKHPLGTGGAIALASSLVEQANVFVLNGDSMCFPDLKKMYEFHLKNSASLTICLSEVNDTSRYGTVVTSDKKEITNFSEKVESSGRGLINAGIYLLSKSALCSFGGNNYLSIENDVFPKLMGKGLYGFFGSHSFIDIGEPAALAAAESFIFKNRYFFKGK